MQLSHHPHPPRAPVTPVSRPQPGRGAAPWPFYVQAPRQRSSDVEANARRVLETSARYFSAPVAEPAALQRGALKLLK